MTAPSEEFILHCDIPGCEAQLSMVAGIPRSEHGWGRCTIHTPLSSDWSFGQNYDLCAQHYRGLRDFLDGQGE